MMFDASEALSDTKNTKSAPAWRVAFLTFASLMAFLTGAFALFFPAAFLATKGVEPAAATEIWMRETGLLLLGLSILGFAARRMTDVRFLSMFAAANLMVQMGLLAIEAIAYANGTIPWISAIAPNTALHLLLGAGFASILLRTK